VDFLISIKSHVLHSQEIVLEGETMKDALRKIQVVLLLVCLMACGSAMAEETGGLTKLSEHVYAAVDFKNATPADNSFGVNTGIVIGNDAVLVVDTRISAKKAQEFIADIRKVTDKPIKYVVNTHYHLDHSWGNCEFVKLGAVVIGQENGPKLASRYIEGISHPENYGLTAEDINGTTISTPTITFKDTLLVDLGGVTVSLSYLGHTHTNDSIVALVEQDGVLFAGDALFVRYHPSMGDADVQGWLKALAELEKTPAKIIVPGHGPVSTVADIKDLEVYLTEFDKQAKVLCAGKTQNDAPTIVRELLKVLPDQKRTELVWAVESNLRAKYLPRGQR
jgi:glyoxylase-like metal-dependent hydrolase (beta-lactamase superfamily II)